MDKVEVKRLPFGDYTSDGSYYARVGGYAVGEAGRAFWPTEEDARACGERYAAKIGGDHA